MELIEDIKNRWQEYKDIKHITIKKEIKKNRSYIINIKEYKVYYTLPKITDNMEGYFCITYNRDAQNLSISLQAGDIDYIFIPFFAQNVFYLIPLIHLPVVIKNNSSYYSRAVRLYPPFLPRITNHHYSLKFYYEIESIL